VFGNENMKNIDLVGWAVIWMACVQTAYVFFAASAYLAKIETEKHNRRFQADMAQRAKERFPSKAD